MFNILKNILLLNFLKSLIKRDLIKYPTPKNLTYFWNYGSLAGLFLAIQLITGFLLTLHYMASIEMAFNCIESIMKDLNYGWLLRYMHSNGASFFFITIYIHIIKAFHFTSYLYPRHILWSSGVIIFILSMGAAFLGYVLPWGQMSYWAATVITNLITVLPYFGNDLVYWVRGGYNINSNTLSRFYSLHFILPFVITLMVIYHLYELHIVGSSNYLNNSLISLDKINFFPYFIIKDLFGLLLLILLFINLFSFYPEYLSHSDNYIAADPLVTPAHIVPEWYFLAFHAISRSILDKLYGIIFMGLSLGGLLLLPFIVDKSVKNVSFSYTDYIINMSLIIIFIYLSIMGVAFPISPFIEVGCILAHALLLFYFLIIPLSSNLYNNIYFENVTNNINYIKVENGLVAKVLIQVTIKIIRLIIRTMFGIFILIIILSLTQSDIVEFKGNLLSNENFVLPEELIKLPGMPITQQLPLLCIFVLPDLNIPMIYFTPAEPPHSPELFRHLFDATLNNKEYDNINEKAILFIKETDKTSLTLIEKYFNFDTDNNISFFDLILELLIHVFNTNPMTVRAYGMLILFFQVNFIIMIIFFFVCFLIFAIIENYNVTFKSFKQNYLESHESLLDLIFVLCSSAIVSYICFLSLSQLYSADSINSFYYDLCIDVTGHQWYWGYGYRDSFNYFLKYFYSDNILAHKDSIVNHSIYFESNLNLAINFNRLLLCDNMLVLPVDTWICAVIGSNDVIHSWSVPNFGIKQDAIPGKIAVQVFRSEIVGQVFGQCSELCGTNHAFMPINIHIITKERFLLWYHLMTLSSNLDNAYEHFLKNVINVTFDEEAVIEEETKLNELLNLL